LAKEQFCSRSQAGACVKLFQRFEVDNSLAVSNTGVPSQLFWDFKKIPRAAMFILQSRLMRIIMLIVRGWTFFFSQLVSFPPVGVLIVYVPSEFALFVFLFTVSPISTTVLIIFFCA